MRARSFDVIVSHGVLHRTGNPGAALDSLLRVLKPAGASALFVFGTLGHFLNNAERPIMRLARRLGAILKRRVTGAPVSTAERTPPSLLVRCVAQACVLTLGLRGYSIGFSFCGRKPLGTS